MTRRLALLAVAFAACGRDEPKPLGEPATAPTQSEDTRPGGATSSGAEGEPLPTSLAWPGFPEGTNVAGTVRLADFADPDGTKGIAALYVETVTPLCAICVNERADLGARADGTWKDLGIHVLQLVLEDEEGIPADVSAALAWKKSSGASWSVVADPGFTFSRAGTNHLPVRLVVDPRTMTVSSRYEGKDTGFSQVEALAKANAPR